MLNPSSQGDRATAWAGGEATQRSDLMPLSVSGEHKLIDQGSKVAGGFIAERNTNVCQYPRERAASSLYRADTARKFLERDATSSCPPKVLTILKRSLSTCF